LADSISSNGPRGTVLTGSLVALVGALAFAPITTLARLAYDAGADGASLVLCRYLLAVLALWAMLLLRGRLPLLPRGAWGKSLAAGVCWIGGTYGYLGAVEYIPVSLAAVAIYAYPLVVAAFSPFVEKTRLTLLHGLAFLTAFGGLALALGPDLSTLDWRGLALAGVGIVGSAGMLLLTARQAPEVDSMTHTFWVNLVGLAGVGLLVNFTGGLRLPGTSDGWLAFAAALSIYIVAILAVLGGAKLAGAARTAMIMNLEPIITLGLATLVLGEILGWEQLVGAGLVLGAVMGITWLDLRRGGTPPGRPQPVGLPRRLGSAGLGVAAAFAAATVYAATTILAALSYRAGGNPQTLLASRFLVTALAVGLTAAALGRSFRVPRTLWPALLLGGFGLMGMSAGYIGSVDFIPVSLAALLFYVFPLLVATASAVVDRQPLRPVALLAYLLAFGGLALALGPSFEALDWRGIALALGGAAGAAVMFLGTRRLTRSLDAAVATTLLSLVAGALAVALLYGTGGPRFPGGGSGPWLLAALCLAFVLALVLHVEAIRSAGPARVAMIFNFEPALTVLIAALWLGESLSWPQLGGVGLVLAALILAALPARRALTAPA
jgi:drug/metabolite transporter (DMT)-like permease